MLAASFLYNPNLSRQIDWLAHSEQRGGELGFLFLFLFLDHDEGAIWPKGVTDSFRHETESQRGK